MYFSLPHHAFEFSLCAFSAAGFLARLYPPPSLLWWRPYAQTGKVYKSEGVSIYTAIAAGALTGCLGGRRTVISLESHYLANDPSSPRILDPYSYNLTEIQFMIGGAFVGATTAAYAYLTNRGPNAAQQ